MHYVSLNLFRDAYISKMDTDLCYQLKINNDEKRKLTLKDNPKHDGTIYDMQIWIWKNPKAYLIEINLLIRYENRHHSIYTLIQTVN